MYHKTLKSVTSVALLAITTVLAAQPASAERKVYPVSGPVVAVQTQQAKVKTLRLGYLAIPDESGKWLYNGGDNQAVTLVFEGLARFDSAGTAVPGGAESWSSDASLKEWVFTIRKGLAYSDGSLLNAKRFEYALIAFLNPVNENFNTRALSAIPGVNAWGEAFFALSEEKDATKQAALKTALADAEKAVRASIRAQDAKDKPCTSYTQADCLKLRISLEAPLPDLPDLIAGYPSMPFKEERIKAKQWWLRANNWIGNGPYILHRTDGKFEREFRPNTRYWRGVAKTNVTVTGAETLDALLADYTAGKLDILSLVNAGATPEQIKSMPAAELRSYGSSCTSNVIMRSMQKPFEDVNVRRAFAAAFDRQRFSQDATGGEIVPAVTWIPEGIPGAIKGEKRNAFDLAASRKLLAASSYKSVDALPKIVIPYIKDEAFLKNMVTAVSTQLKDNLPGIKIELRAVEPDDWEKVRNDPTSDAGMFWGMWCGTRSEDYIGNYFRSGKRGTIVSGWSSKAFDDIADKMTLERDAAKRAALATQAHNILIEESPFIFTGAFATRSLVKPNVQTGPTSLFDGNFPSDIDPLTWDIK
jgi:oligopeptide transport system substrate-binding protein